jgi:predicted dehydrogenase
MKALRLGIVGPGLAWQRLHAPVLSTMTKECVPVAFTGTRRGQDYAAKAYPQARWHDTIQALVADPEVDAVLVTTPIPLNAPSALIALEAGKPILIEKPLGRTAQEAGEVAALAARQQLPLVVLEQVVYSPWLPAASVEIERRMGTGASYQRVSHFMFDDGAHDCGGFGKTLWRKTADYPLGPLLDGGIHELAELAFLFGPPVQVRATARKWREGFGAFDLVDVELKHASGAHGTLSYSAALPSNGNGFTACSETGSLRLGKDFVWTPVAGPVETVTAPSRNSHEAMWLTALRHIRGDEKLLYTPSQAVADVRVMDAISRAILSGAWESVTP